MRECVAVGVVCNDVFAWSNETGLVFCTVGSCAWPALCDCLVVLVPLSCNECVSTGNLLRDRYP